jgi:flagellar biosynthesis GTPase FlhF
MIKDYVQLNAVAHTFNSTANPYDNSKATLIGDIHRVRRYFHYVINTLKHIPYLDRQAVDLAISEIRLTYDDDGNVLNNIHAYLRTFCLQNIVASAAEHEQKRQVWTEEQTKLREINNKRRREADALQKLRSKAESDVKLYEVRIQNIVYNEKEVEAAAVKLLQEASGMSTSNTKGDWMSHHEKARKLRSDYQKEKREAQTLLRITEADLAKHAEAHRALTTAIAEDDAQIQDLDAFLKLNLTEEHRKLTVKFGRGLLLYGPPGTGKQFQIVLHTFSKSFYSR